MDSEGSVEGASTIIGTQHCSGHQYNPPPQQGVQVTLG